MDRLLKINNLNKRFGATHALSDVSFQIDYGEKHAILGENGAGKSTLIKILSGVYPQDEGDIEFLGKSYSPGSIKRARKTGVSTAFQELSLLPNLSVAENLFLPKVRKKNVDFLSSKNVEGKANEILIKYGLENLLVSKKVSFLSLAEQQQLEVVRAMIYNPKLLILDESTAALLEPEWLFDHVEKFVSAQNSTVLFITHRLREARRMCNNFTILRNGKIVTTKYFQECSDQEIFNLMSDEKGKVRSGFDRCRTENGCSEENVLVIKNLKMTKKQTDPKGINIELKKGEILGIAGLDGQGQNQLFDTLGGLRPALDGKIEIDGRRASIKSPYDIFKYGMVLIPEERKTQGIFPGMKTVNNVSLSILQKIKNKFGLVNKSNEIKLVDSGAIKVQLHKKYYNKNIEALSGGNQQKAIIARALTSNAKCLLLFDPTRGVDQSTKTNIYNVISDFADNGGSVLFYSTELSEIVGLCDRCAVFYMHQIVEEIPHEDLNEPAILKAMLGFADKKEDRHNDNV